MVAGSAGRVNQNAAVVEAERVRRRIQHVLYPAKTPGVRIVDKSAANAWVN